MQRTFLTRVLVSACALSTAGAALAVEPAREGMRVGVETPAQANLRNAARSKLDIPKGDLAPGGTATASVEGIKTMLENMGYEPKVGDYTSGAKFVFLSIKRGTWTFAITFDLGGDKTVIWLNAFLGSIAEPAKVNPEALLKLIEVDNAIWPSYFVYFSGPKGLYMYRPVKAAELKPAVLRKALDDFMDSVETTGPLWDQSKWVDAAPAAPAAK
jgi:hypothetical protein